MEKQKNVMFGTALNGYKKQDVNAFIASLNANFSAAEERYQREIASLKAELDTLRAEKGETAALREENAALKAKLEESRAQPVPEAESEEIAELRKKAALYDRMSSQLGDMMISANHSAEVMLSEARNEAEQSLASAKSTIAQSASLLSGQLEALYRGANTRAIGEINSAMQQTQRAMNKFLEELSARRTRLEEMLKQNDADTRRTADEQIAKMLDQTQDAIAAIGAKPTVARETEA